MFEGIFQPLHLLVVFVIIMLLFPKKLPELSKSLGEGIRGFKKALNEAETDIASQSAITKKD